MSHFDATYASTQGLSCTMRKFLVSWIPVATLVVVTPACRSKEAPSTSAGDAAVSLGDASVSTRASGSPSQKAAASAARAQAQSGDARKAVVDTSWHEAAVYGVTGTISTKTISGEIARIGESMVGAYTYGDKFDSGRALRLEGKIAARGVTLDETFGAKVTGKLTGEKTDDDRVAGTWKGPDGKRSAALSLKMARRVLPEGYHLRGFGLQSVADSAPTTDTPVAYREQSAELVLFDGPRARRLGEISGTAQGACALGDTLSEAADEQGFSIDKKSVRERYKRTFPSRDVLAIDAVFSGCTRGTATAYVGIVYADGSVKKLVIYSGNPADLAFTDDEQFLAQTL